MTSDFSLALEELRKFEYEKIAWFHSTIGYICDLDTVFLIVYRFYLKINDVKNLIGWKLRHSGNGII